MVITPKKFERYVKERVAQEMLDKNRDYEKNLLQKQTDLAYLQNQINPHFLYNTLECIRGQALNEGMLDIADTVKALAQFFRYSISVKGTVVTIEDEIANLRNYVAIQQYRFRGKFKLEVDLEEDDCEILRKCLIPKLSLQPIVENAIIHGLENTTENGVVTVKAFLVNHSVLLTIQDNGEGMERETLRHLNEKINKNLSDDGRVHSGIGLNNVQKRIQLFFGKEYGISVNSVKGLGTTVEMYFPVKTGL